MLYAHWWAISEGSGGKLNTERMSLNCPGWWLSPNMDIKAIEGTKNVTIHKVQEYTM